MIDSYSHGMEQKTSLAAALMHDPNVLVLNCALDYPPIADQADSRD